MRRPEIALLMTSCWICSVHPIADAIGQMADRGFSHLPLLGESGRPVAVASFRDIAAYIEASLSALS